MQLIVFAFILTVFAAPAMAQEALQFRTADNNINCLILLGEYADVRCDIYDFIPSYTIAPPDCGLDWEGSFVISEDAPRGELGCAGDTIAAPEARVIGDGETISLWKFSCVAADPDLTCVNLEGHGFTISKAKQTIF